MPSRLASLPPDVNCPTEPAGSPRRRTSRSVHAASTATAAGAWDTTASCGLNAAASASPTTPMNVGAGLNSPR